MRKMTLIFTYFFLVHLSGCSNKPKAVNDSFELPVYPALYTQENADSLTLAKPIIVALSGQVVTNLQIPTPIPQATLLLEFEKEKRWTRYTELTTDLEGKFKITQKIFPGNYKLSINSPKKWQGELKFNVSDKPISNLFLTVSEKK
jgi:hypothetical protein